MKEKELMKDYEDILAKEETYWHQKSKEIWLVDGDKNTKYFHISTKQRRERNRISKLKEDGSLIEDPKEIATTNVILFE